MFFGKPHAAGLRPCVTKQPVNLGQDMHFIHAEAGQNCLDHPARLKLREAQLVSHQRPLWSPWRAFP